MPRVNSTASRLSSDTYIIITSHFSDIITEIIDTESLLDHRSEIVYLECATTI